jgi:cleavage and polyadenylation specificity factor subunit 1
VIFLIYAASADNVAFPILSSSSLELIDPINWATVDGYVFVLSSTLPRLTFRRFEFGTNEIVNAVETVRLETLSTQSGNKDFLAVATSVYRGEDLAVRGCVGPSIHRCRRSIDLPRRISLRLRTSFRM